MDESKNLVAFILGNNISRKSSTEYVFRIIIILAFKPGIIFETFFFLDCGVPSPVRSGFLIPTPWGEARWDRYKHGLHVGFQDGEQRCFLRVMKLFCPFVSDINILTERWKFDPQLRDLLSWTESPKTRKRVFRDLKDFLNLVALMSRWYSWRTIFGWKALQKSKRYPQSLNLPCLRRQFLRKASK